MLQIPVGPKTSSLIRHSHERQYGDPGQFPDKAVLLDANIAPGKCNWLSFDIFPHPNSVTIGCRSGRAQVQPVVYLPKELRDKHIHATTILHCSNENLPIG